MNQYIALLIPLLQPLRFEKIVTLQVSNSTQVEETKSPSNNLCHLVTSSNLHCKLVLVEFFSHSHSDGKEDAECQVVLVHHSAWI